MVRPQAQWDGMTDPDTPGPNALTSSVAIDSVRLTLDLYRSGRSGIPYAALQQFTLPILEHYQLDISHTFDQDVTTGNFEDMTLLLDVFEIASTIWDYCALSEQQKPRAFEALKQNLLGPDPSTEDALQFPILLAMLENAWETLSTPPPRQPASPMPTDTDRQTFSPEAGSVALEPPNALYGPEQLELPEAFVLFARPILEHDTLFENPDALDEAMARAQLYWDIAHLPASRHESEIEKTACRLASANEPEEAVRTEALQMIERFRELFPERK